MTDAARLVNRNYDKQIARETLKLAAHDLSLWNSCYKEFNIQNVVDWLRNRAEAI